MTRRIAILLLFLIGLAIVLMLMGSCKTVKNVQKDKEKTSTEIDSAGTSKVKTNMTEKVTTTTTITEQVDTTVTVKGSTVSIEKPLEAMHTGQVFIVENDDVEATVKEVDGKLILKATAKDRKEDLKFNKTTAQTSITDRKQETQAIAEVKKSEDKREEKKTEDKQVTRTGPGLFGWAGLVLLLLALAYTITRRYWKILP